MNAEGTQRDTSRRAGRCEGHVIGTKATRKIEVRTRYTSFLKSDNRILHVVEQKIGKHWSEARS